MRPGLRSRRNPTELRGAQPTASAPQLAGQGSISSTEVQAKKKTTKPRAGNSKKSIKTGASLTKDSLATSRTAAATSPRYNLRRRAPDPQAAKPAEPLPLKSRAAQITKSKAVNPVKGAKPQPARASEPLASRSPLDREVSEDDRSPHGIFRSQRLTQSAVLSSHRFCFSHLR